MENNLSNYNMLARLKEGFQDFCNNKLPSPRDDLFN